MLILCRSNVSIKCQRISSKHGTSAKTIEGMCRFCQAELRTHPDLKREDTLESILKGNDNGRKAATSD